MTFNQPQFTREMYEAQERGRAQHNAERTARAAEGTREHIEELVAAMQTQLELAVLPRHVVNG